MDEKTRETRSAFLEDTARTLQIRTVLIVQLCRGVTEAFKVLCNRR